MSVNRGFLVCVVFGVLCELVAAAVGAEAKSGVSTLSVEPPHGVSLGCQVVAVIDGDTIEVEVVRRVRVRLLDCWAPESRTTDQAKKKAGLDAKLHLADVVGKRATLFVPTGAAQRVGDVFTFDRVLGNVWIEGAAQSLSEYQVQAGHASTAKGRPVGQ